MQLRVHILRELRQANERRLPELRRRTRAPSASGKQRIVERRFWLPQLKTRVWRDPLPVPAGS
jgi:hypothetical protein